jgi:hypothetical protein
VLTRLLANHCTLEHVVFDSCVACETMRFTSTEGLKRVSHDGMPAPWSCIITYMPTVGSGLSCHFCMQVSSLLPTGVSLNFHDVLPADRSYVTYSGSLTTPPFTGALRDFGITAAVVDGCICFDCWSECALQAECVGVLWLTQHATLHRCAASSGVSMVAYVMSG